MIVIVHDVVLVVPSRVDAQDLSVTWPFILFVCLFVYVDSINSFIVLPKYQVTTV